MGTSMHIVFILIVLLLVLAAILWQIRRLVGELAQVACSSLGLGKGTVLPEGGPAEVQPTKRLMMSLPRPFLQAVAFRLTMGWGFYREGFLLSFVRTPAMQKCKAACISAMKARIDRNLAGTGKVHERLAFSWDEFKRQHNIRREGLHNLVTQVTQAVIRALLQLPESLDLMKVRDITAKLPELEEAVASKPAMVLLGVLHLRPLLAGSQLRSAQEYLRDFIEAGAWDQESFCADVIAAGKAHGVDARGCLAELLAGASYNTANVLSVLVWLAVHGQEMTMADGEKRGVLQELKELFLACDELTDQELTNPHMPVPAKADAARTKLHSWMHWTFLNFPNLKYVLRSDPVSGEMKPVDITQMNQLRTGLTPDEILQSANDDGSTFSIGRFACPGQSLARTALLLAARYLFSKDSPVHLGHKPEGRCFVGHAGAGNKLEVKWTSDGITRSDSCTSLGRSSVFSMVPDIVGRGSLRRLSELMGG